MGKKIGVLALQIWISIHPDPISSSCFLLISLIILKVARKQASFFWLILQEVRKYQKLEQREKFSKKRKKLILA